jgi:nucleoside-diphosphate-sugar epimerase
MILVTGGTGLVGSHLLLDLAKTEGKIRAIYRKKSNLDAVKKVFFYYLPSAEVEFLYNKIQWVEAALEDIPALTIAFKGISKVYHCAALVSFNSSDNFKLRKINIEGTANIVNLCITFKVKKVCYISSIATIDLQPGQRFITENFTWFPEKDHSDYAISKHGAEIEIWRATQEGVPAIILNPGVILGPGFWEKGTGQIFRRIDKGLNYHFPKTTGFVGVYDVVELAIKAMNSPIENEQYIVVAENLSFKYVFEEVARKMKKSLPGKSLKPWMVYVGWLYQTAAYYFVGAKKQISRGDHKNLFEHTYYANDKVKKTFSHEFTPVKEVIHKTVAAYKKD